MIAKDGANPSRFEEERDNPFPWTEAAVTDLLPVVRYGLQGR